MITIDYNIQSYNAILSSSDNDNSWISIINICFEEAKETIKTSILSLEIPWWSFLNIKNDIYFITKSNSVSINLTEQAKQLLLLSRNEIINLNSPTLTYTESDINEKLNKSGFIRILKPFQFNNLTNLIRFPSGATFSVPGAGKTTEALAFYSFFKNPRSKLLVVLPKNAFIAWEEQIPECFSYNPTTVRLTGGYDNIRNILYSEPEILLITYQQLINVYEIVGSYLSKFDSFIFVDESHRIKKGVNGKAASAILKLSVVPKHKLVMSGTPMPQDTTDLIPQFNFLYPGIRVTETNIIENITKIYVRTTKQDLGLPLPHFIQTPIKMSSTQQYLYDIVTDDGKRSVEAYLRSRDKNILRSIKKSCMLMIQLISNPALLTNKLPNETLKNILSLGESPKLNYVCKKAHSLAKEKTKVLIWSNFVENVEIIANRLQDLNAVYIHGGVPSGSVNDVNTREYKIKKFLDDDNCFVMVANPAAACEGISLHSKCHYAIYVDRTFNAAHYLQSLDRIHRLGSTSEVTIEVLSTNQTIDDTVENRLSQKAQNMANVLNDPSIIREYEYSDEDNTEDDDVLGMQEDDIEYILSQVWGVS
ncbi:MAG: helicase domain protein [Herbinix sp.]|jgi:SNF2 family DNA or RNA helicase|nr:helicase domain protein [Herbinix sp.]